MKTKSLISVLVLTNLVAFPLITRAQQDSTAKQKNNNVESKIYNFSKGKTKHAGKSLNIMASAGKIKAQAMIHDFYSGMDDADTNYTRKKSGRVFVMVATLIGTPVLGVIPTAICSMVTPSKKHLGIRNGAPNNEAYLKGYCYEAHYIKKRTLWKNYIISSTMWAGVAQLVIL